MKMVWKEMEMSTRGIRDRQGKGYRAPLQKSKSREEYIMIGHLKSDQGSYTDNRSVSIVGPTATGMSTKSLTQSSFFLDSCSEGWAPLAQDTRGSREKQVWALHAHGLEIFGFKS